MLVSPRLCTRKHDTIRNGKRVACNRIATNNKISPNMEMRCGAGFAGTSDEAEMAEEPAQDDSAEAPEDAPASPTGGPAPEAATSDAEEPSDKSCPHTPLEALLRSPNVTVRRKSKHGLTPAQPQYWYESNSPASLSKSDSTDDAGAVTPPNNATHSAAPSPAEVARQQQPQPHSQRARRTRSRTDTPMQPQYWYESNSPAVTSDSATPTRSFAPPSGGEPPAPSPSSARRQQRKRRESMLHTPMQPQYWYEANNRPSGSDSAPGSVVSQQPSLDSAPASAGPRAGLGAGRVPRSAGLTPLQPTYWYEGNDEDDGCPPPGWNAEDDSDDTAADADAAQGQQRATDPPRGGAGRGGAAPASDPGHAQRRRAASPGALGLPRTTGRKRRSSLKGLAPIAEARAVEEAAVGSGSRLRPAGSARSPIVPVALHFTPQKRVRFSDQFEFSAGGADATAPSGGEGDGEAGANVKEAGVIALRFSPSGAPQGRPPALGQRGGSFELRSDARTDPGADDAELEVDSPKSASEEASAEKEEEEVAAADAAIDLTNADDEHSASPASARDEAEASDREEEARAPPRVGNMTPAVRARAESFAPALFAWSEPSAVPALRTHLQSVLSMGSSAAAAGSAAELAAHLQRLNAAKGVVAAEAPPAAALPMPPAGLTATTPARGTPSREEEEAATASPAPAPTSASRLSTPKASTSTPASAAHTPTPTRFDLTATPAKEEEEEEEEEAAEPTPAPTPVYARPSTSKRSTPAPAARTPTPEGFDLTATPSSRGTVSPLS
eukprot:792567-Prorocentrum_minimum.AAC.13